MNKKKRLLLFSFVLIVVVFIAYIKMQPDLTGVVIAKHGRSFLLFEGVSQSQVDYVLNDPQQALHRIDHDVAIWIHGGGNLAEVGDEVEVWLDLNNGGIDASSPASTDSATSVKVIKPAISH